MQELAGFDETPVVDEMLNDIKKLLLAGVLSLADPI
jgi:hypothetical protein